MVALYTEVQSALIMNQNIQNTSGTCQKLSWRNRELAVHRSAGWGLALLHATLDYPRHRARANLSAVRAYTFFFFFFHPQEHTRLRPACMTFTISTRFRIYQQNKEEGRRVACANPPSSPLLACETQSPVCEIGQPLIARD